MPPERRSRIKTRTLTEKKAPETNYSSLPPRPEGSPARTAQGASQSAPVAPQPRTNYGTFAIPGAAKPASPVGGAPSSHYGVPQSAPAAAAPYQSPASVASGQIVYEPWSETDLARAVPLTSGTYGNSSEYGTYPPILASGPVTVPYGAASVVEINYDGSLPRNKIGLLSEIESASNLSELADAFEVASQQGLKITKANSVIRSKVDLKAVADLIRKYSDGKVSPEKTYKKFRQELRSLGLKNKYINDEMFTKMLQVEKEKINYEAAPPNQNNGQRASSLRQQQGQHGGEDKSEGIYGAAPSLEAEAADDHNYTTVKINESARTPGPPPAVTQPVAEQYAPAPARPGPAPAVPPRPQSQPVAAEQYAPAPAPPAVPPRQGQSRPQPVTAQYAAAPANLNRSGPNDQYAAAPARSLETQPTVNPLHRPLPAVSSGRPLPTPPLESRARNSINARLQSQVVALKSSGDPGDIMERLREQTTNISMIVRDTTNMDEFGVVITDDNGVNYNATVTLLNENGQLNATIKSDSNQAVHVVAEIKQQLEKADQPAPARNKL